MQLIIKRVFDAPSPLENLSDKTEHKEWSLLKKPRGEDYQNAVKKCLSDLAYPIIPSSRDNRYLMLREPSIGCDFLIWNYEKEDLEQYFKLRGATGREYFAINNLINQINANENGEDYAFRMVDEENGEIDSNNGYLIYNIPTMLQFLEHLRESVIRCAAVEIEGESVDMTEEVESILSRLKESPFYRTIPITLRI